MTRYLWILLLAAPLLRAEQPIANSSAPPESVEIELFSDFQCPYCRQISQPIRDLMTKGVEGIQTKVIFKEFPLSFHSNAQLAAQAALAAGEQGNFWQMHDLLFANQSALKREDLLANAKKLGLDLNRFTRDLDSDRLKKVIASDQAEGAKLDVNGTPTFFINGVSYSGARSYEDLKILVQKEHGRTHALAEITDNLLSRGPVNARVTLEFYADLESPVSRPTMSVIDELLQRYPSAVRLQFRSFPLAFHPQAPLAHEAAMAAAKQGHFWDFANYILEHQDSLREQDLIAYSGKLGMDENKFAEVLRQRRYGARVDADLAEGAKRGIRGSPVIFVNSKRIDGVPSLQALSQYVEEELAKK
jgi:protein-disulfide isomerase